MRKKPKRRFHEIKEKTHAIYDAFDKKDVAQMLTSIFIIVQVFAVPLSKYQIHQTFLLFITSVVVCGFIVWLVAKKDFLDHIITGILIVSVFSFIIGFILNQPIENIFLAMTVGLPVAMLVNVLKK